jgi:hypothetical protein
MSLILRGRDLQGATSLLATQRVQDAFGLANFHFDKGSGHILRDKLNGRAVLGPGRTSDATRDANSGGTSPTNVLVLRDGKVYFQGAADELLSSTDAYLKEFLASAR